MKKHLIKFEAVAIAAIVALCVSCDDMLDPKSETNLTEEYANTSYANTLARSVGLYSYLPNGLSYIDGAMMASACDEAEHTQENCTIQRFNVGNWNASSAPDEGAWQRNFQGIYACNLFLVSCDSVNMDYLKYDPAKQADFLTRSESIERWKQEARVLRAFYYFELVKRYGGVPIITEPLDMSSSLDEIKREPLAKCIQFIVDECDSAAVYLPNPDKMPDEANNLGRVNKATALAIKCRTLLYAASDLFNHPEQWAEGYEHPELISIVDTLTQEDRWKKAAEATNSFVATLGGKYALGEYRGTRLFDSQELIFCTRMGSSNSFEKANYPIGYYLGQSGTTPSQNLVDAYEMKDGTPFDWNNPEHAANPYANRDPRLEMSILTNNAYFKTRPIEAWAGGLDGEGIIHATRTGYYLYKFIDPNLDLVNNKTSVHAWTLFRYSELLLDHAEAMNEAYGPTTRPAGYRAPNALTAVNRVREREGVKMPDFAKTITQEELREKIRAERRVELAFEDHRFWDVRRWMIAEETLGAPLRGVDVVKTGEDTYEYTPKVVESRAFEKKMYLYPIPQSVINTMNWPQNPLW